MRRATLLGVLLAIAVALPAGAYPPITCGRVTVKGTVLVVKRHGQTCTEAKRWVRTWLERKRAPKGYRCKAYGEALPVHCVKPRRSSQYFLANPPA